MSPEDALKIYHNGCQSVVKEICFLSNKVGKLEAHIKTLNDKIALLSKNSSTSGKRPSSDDITKPKKKNKKKKSDRKTGGQTGHPKHTRAPYPEEQVDRIIPWAIAACPVCNGPVVLSNEPPKTLQQVEITKKPVTVEEHRSYPFWCENCQIIHYAPFPPNVIKEGLFKEDITALVAFMKHVLHASFSSIGKFFRDVLNVPVSRGYLRKVIEKVSNSLEAPFLELLKRLPLEKTLNVDETGHKENKERFWTWVFRTDLFVLFKIEKSRGSKVLIDVLGKEFNGILGCDYYSAYRKYMKDFNITVQFCLAHLIRDIRFLTTLPDEETKNYGKKLLEKIKNMFKVIHDRELYSEEDFIKALGYAKNDILEVALSPPSKMGNNGKEEKNHAQNMANRFRKHGAAYFEFITTPGIDPTNNLAEQAIRFVVIDRHVTQGTRSIKGRQSSERLWTTIATCELQGKSAFHFIVKAVRAFFNSEPAPSLIPENS